MYGQRDGEKRSAYSERGYWTSAAGRASEVNRRKGETALETETAELTPHGSLEDELALLVLLRRLVGSVCRRVRSPSAFPLPSQIRRTERVRADSAPETQLTVLPTERFSAFGAHDVPHCVQSGGHGSVFWRAEGDVDSARGRRQTVQSRGCAGRDRRPRVRRKLTR